MPKLMRWDLSCRVDLFVSKFSIGLVVKLLCFGVNNKIFFFFILIEIGIEMEMNPYFLVFT